MPLTPVRLLAATALVAAAGVVVPAPAQAATCASDTGVSVVVDFTGAGDGGIQSACVIDGGGDTANSLFGAAGHELTRVDSQPGAVCKVDGLRTNDACAQMPPTNAYWGIFWSDGSGGWIYSTEGVDSLNVPDGGSVAFAWQDGGSYNYPGVAAPQHEEEAEPSQQPQPSNPPAGGGDGGGGGSGGGSGSTPGTSPSTATETPGAATSAKPSASPQSGDRRDRDRPRDRAADEDESKQRGKNVREGGGAEPDESSASATPEAGEDATPATSPRVVENEGLPAWVAPVAVGGLFALAGIVALARRRSTA